MHSVGGDLPKLPSAPSPSLKSLIATTQNKINNMRKKQKPVLVHTEEHNRRRRLSCNKYEKTKRGFIMRLYRNMKSRVDGVQAAKYHLYRGLGILEKEKFYQWANCQPEFHSLFCEYEASGYERRLAPSVDRIDSSVGYEIDNMEFVTMSENSRRGTISRFNKN
jgi:hypothetical protein